MPTSLDRALNSKNAFVAFTGLVTAVAIWGIWGGDMFPKEADPVGEPEMWTREELRRWLAVRNLHPNASDTDAELLDRVKANLQIQRT